MLEKIFAGCVILICAALLLRLALSRARRARLDRSVARMFRSTRRSFGTAQAAARQALHRRKARRIADAAIRKARGSVGKSRHERPPRKDRTLH